VYRLLVGRPEGRRPLGRPKIGGFIIFNVLQDFNMPEDCSLRRKLPVNS
jgi:hypothetical protein